MTSIEVLDALRADLVAQQEAAARQRDDYRDGGDPLQAFGYDMVRLGLTRAIESLDQVLKAELDTFRRGAN